MCLGNGAFEAQPLGIDEGQYVEVSNEKPIFTVFLLNFIQGFWEMSRQNAELQHHPRESYPTTHVFPFLYCTHVIDHKFHRARPPPVFVVIFDVFLGRGGEVDSG